MEDKAKEPDKDAMPDTLGGGIEGEADPYLDQLDSSMEDIIRQCRPRGQNFFDKHIRQDELHLPG